MDLNIQHSVATLIADSEQELAKLIGVETYGYSHADAVYTARNNLSGLSERTVDDSQLTKIHFLEIVVAHYEKLIKDQLKQKQDEEEKIIKNLEQCLDAARARQRSIQESIDLLS